MIYRIRFADINADTDDVVLYVDTDKDLDADELEDIFDGVVTNREDLGLGHSTVGILADFLEATGLKESRDVPREIVISC